MNRLQTLYTQDEYDDAYDQGFQDGVDQMILADKQMPIAYHTQGDGSITLSPTVTDPNDDVDFMKEREQTDVA